MLISKSAYCAALNNNGSGASQGNNVDVIGAGMSIVKRIELIDGLLDFDESEDSIFIMPEIFYDQHD